VAAQQLFQAAPCSGDVRSMHITRLPAAALSPSEAKPPEAGK
jgi:hypothetical protein